MSSPNGWSVNLADCAPGQVRLAEREALQVALACRRSDLPLHVFGPCDDGLRPVNSAVSRLRLDDLEPRVAQAPSFSDIRCVERTRGISGRRFPRADTKSR